MREHENIFLIIAVIACIVLAGCVQSSGRSPVTPALPPATVQSPEPVTIGPTATATGTPAAVATIIRYTSPPRDLKDSKLLFTLQVPAAWNVSTLQLTKSDTADYRTDLVAGNVFSITSYPATRSRVQEFREEFRQWSPAPAETATTINGIRYDRFESRAGGNTTVAYLPNANSANERGYASVLVFTARDCNKFDTEDFEAVVSSFRYFSAGSAGTMPGEEIPHYSVSGNTASQKTGIVDSRVFDSSDWDSGSNSGDSSSDSTSTDTDTSGGGSSGGGCSNR
jgi:uncharacterized membrane protein YgcG